MTTNHSSDQHIFLRVAIVGALRLKVAKVLSLIANQPSVQDHDDEPEKRQIHIEYVPCVATFDSYENENGESVKYLVKLEHHGKDGQSGGASLAPFFDEVIDDKKNIHVTGIAGISVGCGIESDEEIEMISSFINSISGGIDNAKDDDENVVMKCIKPNAEYSTMKEETVAYKDLSLEGKEAVTESQSMGPAKMAKFTMEIATECIPRSKMALDKQAQIDANANMENEAKDDEEVEPPPPTMPKAYDQSTTRFACKMCRTILFSEAELEDPPHTQSQHNFSNRKTKTAGINSSLGNKCHYVFIGDSLDWMGDIRLQNEGKLACPKCCGKLGLYKWHGTQCSCGTWVVPAIMVHNGRVDIVKPKNELQSLTSPLAGLYVGGQS